MHRLSCKTANLIGYSTVNITCPYYKLCAGLDSVVWRLIFVKYSLDKVKASKEFLSVTHIVVLVDIKPRVSDLLLNTRARIPLSH